MRICKQCQSPMNEGYSLKVNTYGMVQIEKKQAKSDYIKAAICPSCGEISLYIENNIVN